MGELATNVDGGNSTFVTRLGGALVLGASLALLGGCGPQLPGVVSPGAYDSGRYALGVVGDGRDPASMGLMPEGWKLDNFNGDEPKQGPEYQAVYRLDPGGDGSSYWVKKDVAYELRFIHRRHAGIVWLRAIPVSTDLGQKDLSVLVEAYVEALAGGAYETLQISESRATTVEKRFASRLLDSRPCHLASSECQLATIELANVDQLKLDPNYRSHKLTVVITRASFLYDAGYNMKFPIFLVAGYSNQPAQFDAGSAEFYGFLQRISIDGQRGFAASAPPAGAAPAVAPPAAAAPGAAP